MSMKYILEDGRILAASYDDIREFFDEHHIAGRTIRDLRSARNDYMIRNLYDFEIEELEHWTTESCIDTDGPIAILFTDGDNLEIEFCGDGPVLLGFNTADLSKYPEYNGECYKLATLFQHSIDRTITEVFFERSDHRMMFPMYKGIDMSADDDGVQEIRLVLDDGSCLTANGKIDWFVFAHEGVAGEEFRLPYAELLEELSPEIKHRLFVEHKGI